MAETVKNEIFYRKKDNILKYPLSKEHYQYLQEYDQLTRHDKVIDMLNYTHSCVNHVSYVREKGRFHVEVELGSCCGSVPPSLKHIIVGCIDKVLAKKVDAEDDNGASYGGCR